MKRVTKLGLLAVSAVLALASCAPVLEATAPEGATDIAEFSRTNVDNTSGYDIDITETLGGGSLDITAVAAGVGTPAYPHGTLGLYIDFNVNAQWDILKLTGTEFDNKLKENIKFFNLKPRTGTTINYGALTDFLGDTINYSVDRRVGNRVYITLTKADIKSIGITAVTYAEKNTFNSGKTVDWNNDGLVDSYDDRYYWFPVTGAGLTAGTILVPDATSETVSLTTSITATEDVTNTANHPYTYTPYGYATVTLSNSFTDTIGSGNYDLSSDYKAWFDANVELQQLGDGGWTKVSTSNAQYVSSAAGSSVTVTGASAHTGTLPQGTYFLQFTPVDHTVYRLFIKNVDTFLTQKEYLGFKQKLTDVNGSLTNQLSTYSYREANITPYNIPNPANNPISGDFWTSSM
ncbi:hypothetical protein FACS1894142_6490 [Spirochaetia bacterium]|nr:hypothetical protein FACS1894142_6490 [Spirochaetia bacterium]